MEYLIAFWKGIITLHLPLPFAHAANLRVVPCRSKREEGKKNAMFLERRRLWSSALPCFFMLLGAGAGLFGRFFSKLTEPQSTSRRRRRRLIRPFYLGLSVCRF